MQTRIPPLLNSLGHFYKFKIPSFRRRPESSEFIKNAFVPVRCAVCFIVWIPAFAGMTNL